MVWLEPTEEEKRTISIFGVKAVVIIVVEDFRVEKFKERDVVEEVDVGRESYRAEGIFCIWVALNQFSRVSDSLLKVASNVTTDDWLATIDGIGTEKLTEEEA